MLDATVVYFDPDGTDQQPRVPPPPVIADVTALDAFAQRYVDGAPPLGSAAGDALNDGLVLVGGTVSSGCFAAEGARLAFTAVDIRLLPIGLPPEDPDLMCERAITSIVLMAIDASELPAGLPIRGSCCGLRGPGDDVQADFDVWCEQLEVAMTASAELDDLSRDDPGFDDVLAAVQDEIAALSNLEMPRAIASDWETLSGPPPTNGTGGFVLDGELAGARERIAAWAVQECDLSRDARAALAAQQDG